jgi:hypothetical protein
MSHFLIRFAFLLFVASGFLGGEEVSDAGSSDADSGKASAGFESRYREALSGFAGKPMEKPYVSPNKLYVRPQSFIYLNYAYRLFLLGERAGEANEAVVSFCNLYKDHLAFMRDGDSFYWAGDLLFSIMENFGSEGRISRGKLTSASEERILRMLWIYSSNQSKIADAEVEKSATWDVWGSENHHIQKFYMNWHASKFLMKHPAYAKRTYEDGHPASTHFSAWTRYAKHWISQRARKGLFVEFAHESYNLTTIKGVYNFHEFSGDPRLRRLSAQLLDVFWVDWAQEQLDGIRGGAKARVYQGEESLTGGKGSNSPLYQMRYFYTGLGEVAPIEGNLLTLLQNSYRPPPIVLQLMVDQAGRGSYEIIQSRLGLAKDGRRGPPDYRLDQRSGGLVRYSYCTPSFILGAFHCEARSERDWTMISSQNRWLGAVFQGHPNARVVVQCSAGEHRANYHAIWAAQSKGSMIAQKLPPGRSKYAGAMRVWIGSGGLRRSYEKNGIVFAHYPGALCAIRVVQGGYRWVNDADKRLNGRWLELKSEFSPVIIEVAQRTANASDEAFEKKILGLVPRVEKSVVHYGSLYGGEFQFPTDYKGLPKIDGKPLDLRPSMAMESPFLAADFDSGIVALRKGDVRVVYDFRLREGE